MRSAGLASPVSLAETLEWVWTPSLQLRLFSVFDVRNSPFILQFLCCVAHRVSELCCYMAHWPTEFELFSAGMVFALLVLPSVPSGYIRLSVESHQSLTHQMLNHVNRHIQMSTRPSLCSPHVLSSLRVCLVNDWTRFRNDVGGSTEFPEPSGADRLNTTVCSAVKALTRFRTESAHSSCPSRSSEHGLFWRDIAPRQCCVLVLQTCTQGQCQFRLLSAGDVKFRHNC